MILPLPPDRRACLYAADQSLLVTRGGHLAGNSPAFLGEFPALFSNRRGMLLTHKIELRPTPEQATYIKAAA